MGDIRINIPQQIHVEYTIRNGFLTKNLLDLINTLMLQSKTVSDDQDDLLGLYSHQPELLDQITESIMESRETSSLRV